MVILGLDISTSNIGMVLMESGDPQRHRLIESNGYPISGIPGLWSKACFIREKLLEMTSETLPDCVVVEESLMSFQRNRSSAGVLAILNRFNGIVSFVARDTLGVPVYFVPSTTARKGVGIKLDKTRDTKEQIFEWVRYQSQMTNYMWPTKVMKSGPRKGQKVFEGHCLDIADAYVVAAWACSNLKKEDLNNTIC